MPCSANTGIFEFAIPEFAFMPKLKIDNREIEVPEGTKVIEAAERVGIMIPRFCYHPALGPVGACRVCAVAFKDGPVKGVQMSCMVDAQEGMVVSTTDGEAVDFRRHVIEWLMLHHPHDCPVCDVGGNCLLQDMTVSGGHGLRRYPGRKRTYNDQYLGPLIQHEMNRCIQCYRCSRYYQEYSGYRDLGVMGSASRIYFGRSTAGRLESPFCGNLLEVCPTGVYTDKPSRYFGRRWEFERAPCICLHCSLGCNTVSSARYRRVVRQEARFNSAVNGYFICDRGRYGFAYASEKERPRAALANGQALAVEEVLDQAGKRLAAIADRFGPESVAAVASARSSLETLTAVQQACRENNWSGPAAALTIRARENQTAAVSRLTSGTVLSMGDLQGADTVVVVGADPLNEAPMLALALRQAQRRGARVFVIDPRGIDLPLAFDHWAVHSQELKKVLQQLIHALAPADASSESGDRLRELIDQIKAGRKTAVVCGTDIVTCEEITLAADLAAAIRRTGPDAGLFYTFAGANDFATALMPPPAGGASSVELLLEQIENGNIRALLAVETDMWSQFPNRQRLLRGLQDLELLIVLDYVASPLNDSAHFFIPTQTVFEHGGHWINQEGRLQAARPGFGGGQSIEITGNMDHPPRVFDARTPGAEPIPASRAVSILAGLTDGQATAATDQRAPTAFEQFHPALASLDTPAGGSRLKLEAVTGPETGCIREGTTGAAALPADAITLLLVERTFGTEALSSHSTVLSEQADAPAARMHPEELQRLGLQAGGRIVLSTKKGSLELPLAADDRMAPGVLTIPRHHLLDWQIFDDTRTTVDSGQIKPAQPG